MKILVIAIPGLGNTLLAMPMLKEIRRYFPESRIDLLVGLKASEEMMKSCHYINNIFFINKKILKNFSENIKTLTKLKNENYDVSITTFPATQPHYNFLAGFIGAKKRITHNYKKNFVWLQTNLVPINICHDVEQNLNLLSRLGIKLQRKKHHLDIWLSKEEKDFASSFTKKYNGKKIIGVHPGSSIERGMKEKRWSIKNFSELLNKLSKNNKLHFFVFIGPDEKELELIKDYVTEKSKLTIIKDTEIRKVAAIISKCKLFISNDSGLMHVAVSCKVPTLGIFTQTDYRRTKPYGKNCKVIYKGKTYLDFRQSIEKLANISTEYIKTAAKQEITSNDVLKLSKKMLK